MSLDAELRETGEPALKARLIDTSVEAGLYCYRGAVGQAADPASVWAQYAAQWPDFPRAARGAPR